MKKSLKLREQVEAARQEVDKWPEMIKKATEIQYVIFTSDDEEVKIKESVKKEGKHLRQC